MVKWEYLEFRVGSDRGGYGCDKLYIKVKDSEIEATAQQLKGALPPSWEVRAKDGLIETKFYSFKGRLLNELGEMGWEAVGFETGNWLFKRPREE